jgi:hypothetical protein
MNNILKLVLYIFKKLIVMKTTDTFPVSTYIWNNKTTLM